MLHEIWLYLCAVVGKWFTGYWFLTGIPEAASYVVSGDLMPRCISAFVEKISPNTRQEICRLLFIVGFLIAGFLAWDDQYRIAITKSPEEVEWTISRLRNQVDTLQKYKNSHQAYEWPGLTPKMK